MSLWSDTPRIQGPPDTQDVGQILAYVKDLANTVAKMAKDLEFLVNGNLDANNIRANSIETKNLKANSITADKIQAGAVTAEKISVNELSAISANLGHIVAGLIESVEIYGSYIATRRGSFPRAEMSNADNLFAAYYDSRNYIQVQADYGYGPSLNIFHDGMVVGRFNALSGSLGIDSIGTLIITVQNGNIDISSGKKLIMPRFSNVVSSDGENLAVTLDRKATAGVSTNPSGGHNHGIPDGTVLRTADGGTVTYRAAAPHTHEQTS